ncbi:MAG: FHA domain-containing protein, partial [Kiritimatiellia bacterium]
QIQIQIDEGEDLLLGRLQKCDVILEDGSISSQHARLKLLNHQLRVIDLDSTNGTRLNYSLLTEPAYLLDGDTLEFGNMTFVVDGPGLTVPAELDLSAQTLTSLEPLEASQKLEDTMINMDLSLEELDAEDSASLPELFPSAPVEEPDHHLPVRLAFVLALLLLLVSGTILLLTLWKTPPQI